MLSRRWIKATQRGRGLGCRKTRREQDCVRRRRHNSMGNRNKLNCQKYTRMLSRIIVVLDKTSDFFCDPEEHCDPPRVQLCIFCKCFLSQFPLFIFIINPVTWGKLACLSHCNLKEPNLIFYIPVCIWFCLLQNIFLVPSVGLVLLAHQHLVSYSSDHRQWFCIFYICSVPRGLWPWGEQANLGH